MMWVIHKQLLAQMKPINNAGVTQANVPHLIRHPEDGLFDLRLRESPGRRFSGLERGDWGFAGKTR